jgi:hypothetical protein
MKMIQLKLIWIQPTYIQFNWDFMKNITTLNPKGKNIQFKNLNSNQIQLSFIIQIHSILNYSNEI